MMMSARDFAVAALSDVVANQLSESHESQSDGVALPRSTDHDTAASIAAPTPKDVTGTAPQESNASAIFQTTSSNNSQETGAEASTPPTSDGFSTQSQGSQSQLSQYSQPQTTPLPSSQATDNLSPSLSLATSAGQKRTHDGYTKPPDSCSSTSPPLRSFGGHSRNTSTISTASSAVSSRELVSELRTRLSYAMTKVNNGWESLPIDEVETLTSQSGSPTSSTSTLHARRNIYTSPRTVMASMQPDSRDHHRDVPPFGNMASSLSSQRDPVLFSDNQPSRTYESFWREQSQRHTVPSNFTSPSSSQPSLAPPADITSAARTNHNSRRSETPKLSRPPRLLGQTTSDLSQNSLFSASTSVPHTPNRTSNPSDAIMQTPGQKSNKERDAIETLMFMSSPGTNSLNHAFPPPGQSSQQPSPLRADFGTPLRGSQGQFRAGSNGTSEAESIIPEGSRRGRHTGHPLSGDDLDRMLDMPDEDSSDEEIEIPITPRRLAAGRV